MLSLKPAATASYLKNGDEATYPKYDANSLPTAEKYNKFHDGTLNVSLPIAVSRPPVITTLLSYVFPLGEVARKGMKGRELQGAVVPSDKDGSFLYGVIMVSFAY